LGKTEFVNWVRSKFLVDREDKEIPDLKRLRERISIERIETEVRRRVKKQRLYRKIRVCLVRKYTNKKLKEIGALYGNIFYSGISQMYRRMEKDRKENKKMDLLISEIEKMCNVKI